MSALNRYFVLVCSATAAIFFMLNGDIAALPWAITCFVLKMHVNDLTDDLAETRSMLRGLAEKGKQ